jgi:hypothetical protein
MATSSLGGDDCICMKWVDTFLWMNVHIYFVVSTFHVSRRCRQTLVLAFGTINACRYFTIQCMYFMT